jgi:hypothetical protein
MEWRKGLSIVILSVQTKNAVWVIGLESFLPILDSLLSTRPINLQIPAFRRNGYHLFLFRFKEMKTLLIYTG